MDCQMPIMDGYEATSRIRKSIHAGIPIIAVTAGAMLEQRDRCLSQMNDYLAKPVDVGRLSDVLARWLPVSGSENRKPTPAMPVPEMADVPINVFNADDLLERLMGDRQLATVILKAFLGDAPSQLNNLRKQLDEANAPGVRLQAHSLKGAAATVAAESLRAIALAMEQSGAGGQLDKCRELLPHAVGEFERFKETLERTAWV
jgi:CheY-like chemotaxis protein